MICPFCLLGKKKIEAAVAKLPADVKVNYEWRPFQLDPSLPTPGTDKQTRYAQKFGARIGPMLQQLTATGKGWGINFNFTGKIGNTLNAHRLVEWSKQSEQGGGSRTDALMTALMSGYHEHNSDLASEADLVAAAKAAQLPASEEQVRAFLRGDELRKQVEEDVRNAQEADISGVPHFFIESKGQVIPVSGAQEPDAFVHVFKKLGVA